jgi:transcriptional regulator with XRE-family HTH domain
MVPLARAQLDEVEEGAVVRVKRLSELRRRRGWTVVELAVRANLSETTVRRLELGLAGAPRPATVRALATALGVSPGMIAELSRTPLA